MCTSVYNLQTLFLSEKVRNKEREWVNNADIGPVCGRKREWRRGM